MADRNLLFVVGGSPQIVTETVFALLSKGGGATDVHVLTTTVGRDALRAQVLARGGAWGRLRREYPGARRFRFSARAVQVLQDARGRPLADLRSADDSVAAADQIARRVADLTRDGCPPLHASIAGGRKTMGYLLAAAMMVHGRRADRLSHVLVHPSDLEGTDFFFPPRRRSGYAIHRRGDGVAVRIGAGAVRIELAELPFPRLRGLRGGTELHNATFSQLVNDLQDDLDALAVPQVVVDAGRGMVLCADRLVRLSPLRLAIYELLAARRRDGCGRTGCSGCARCFVPAVEIGGPVRQALRETLQRRSSIGVGGMWDARNFRPEVRKINAAIERELRGASRPYRIRAIGPRTERAYGLGLDPESIRIVDGNFGANVAG